MYQIPVWALAAVCVCAAAGLLLLRARVLAPLGKLKELTQRLDELTAAEISRQALEIDGVPGEAARAFSALLSAAEAKKPGTDEADPAAEERYKMSVVDEICDSLVPQPLRVCNASLSFSLAGGVRQGKRRNCAFYDHFYLDENTLCFSVGEVPGNGIGQALFAVVAQIAVRNQLRLGRSLTETMSDVNFRLFALSGKNSVRAVVCVLNTVNGDLTFVNAGSVVPFLMRGGDPYEELGTPVYAPLGENESVVYRPEVLRLTQGDRLFLCTADLGEMRDREGEAFRERELLSALNRSRSRSGEPEETLRYIQDEAAAFCENGNDVLSSAAMVLEYRKGDRDFVYTVVPAAPSSACAVTGFLRRTLEENGISPRDGAGAILLAEEAFTLCCRACGEEAGIRAECAVKKEEKAVHLRLFAPMGGRDPLSAGDDAVSGSAAQYIRGHVRRAAFEAGAAQDMLEIVCGL